MQPNRRLIEERRSPDIRRLVVLPLVNALSLLVVVLASRCTVVEEPGATPFADPLQGVTVESLTATPPLPFHPLETTAGLARYSFEPDGRVDYPYPGPVLVCVDSGMRVLEGVGCSDSILYPARVLGGGTAEAGREVAVEQIGKSPAEGADAEIPAGGSTYAEDGPLGILRNAAAEPLVRLVVVCATYETWGETGTMIAEEPEIESGFGTNRPIGGENTRHGAPWRRKTQVRRSPLQASRSGIEPCERSAPPRGEGNHPDKRRAAPAPSGRRWGTICGSSRSIEEAASNGRCGRGR